jgi:D-alanine-D-alanine ligase
MTSSTDAEPPGRVGNARALPPRLSAKGLRSGTNGHAVAQPGLGLPGERSPGRVEDLEAYVRSDWWRVIFDKLYLKTDGDVFENDRNTRSEVDALISAAGLRPRDRVLDLCCGQGRHALELARRGFRGVTGVDLSPYLIGLARRRARAAGLDVRFLESDARNFGVAGEQFDCVAILGNSFGYFDRPEDDALLLRRARSFLCANGRLVIDLVDGEWLRAHFERRSWEWVDGRALVCRERSLSGDGGRLVTREIILNADNGVLADRFFAERLYSRAGIENLLEGLGFEAVRFLDPPDVQSDRETDLGMMARRQLVIARAKAGPAVLRARNPREIVVVWGDPRLPDSVKPDGRFGRDDLRTVERLRDALAELPEYRFRYVDDHAKLMSLLRSARPDLVLNLCDEGYRNDAAMEPHVPALLDLLGIPYTGAGPACLTLCYDKSVVRGIAASLGIQVPEEISIDADDSVAEASTQFPALIKPCRGDNSVGIDHRSVVRTPGEASDAIRRLRHLLPGCPILMQEYLEGREYSLGVVGNPGRPYELLPVLEVDYSALDPELPPILAYASKWDPTSPYATQIRYKPAALAEEVERRLVNQALRLLERLGCRDYARFDFRADGQGRIKLLEVNPNPGWCWDGKFSIMAGFAELSYPNLLRLILQAAEHRHSLSCARASTSTEHQPARNRESGECGCNGIATPARKIRRAG